METVQIWWRQYILPVLKKTKQLGELLLFGFELNTYIHHLVLTGCML
jgi:hypothetical protein